MHRWYRCFIQVIHLIAFILILLIGPIKAQPPDKISVSGKVIDAKTSEHLPFASIVIRNTAVGTTANEAGMFMLHVPGDLSDGTIQVSMLGYETQTLSLATITKPDFTIRLKSSTTMLKEVVVQYLTPKEILKRAFQKKPRNYPTVPFQFEGYYREVQRADGKNVSFVEAFSLVHDGGYSKSSPQQHFLKQLRVAQSYNNPVAPFWDNKNLLIAFLSQNFVKSNRTYRHYKMSRKDDVIIDDVLVYVIEVDKRWALWPSRIYIRSDNYAIIRTEEDFSVAEHGSRRWKVEDNPMIESFPQRKTLQINYRLVDGKYYPENYRMYFKNIYQDVIQKKDVLMFEICQQFVVTRLYINDVQPVNFSEAMADNVSLKKIVTPFDSTFWNDSPIRDTPADSLIRLDLLEGSNP